MKTPQHICEVVDDGGHVCGKVVSNKQWKQEGMCSRCAEGLWSAFGAAFCNVPGRLFKPFYHKEANHANIPPKSIVR